MTSTDKTPSKAERLATMRQIEQAAAANIQALKDCTDDAEILAFPYGLGVKFENGSPAAFVRLDLASPAPARLPHLITNGAGEAPRRMRRQEAIKAELEKSADVIAQFARIRSEIEQEAE